MSAHAERIREICDDAQARGAALVKDRFVAGYVTLARQCGFDLAQGDVVLVHPDDVPKAVTLIRDRDPIWINARLVEPGKCLFVDRRLKLMPQYSRLNG